MDDKKNQNQNKNKNKKRGSQPSLTWIYLVIAITLGYMLMSGDGSTEHAYNPDIFSARRIKVAPLVCLAGFVSMIYAVVRRPRS